MNHWIWILAAFFIGGFLGMMVILHLNKSIIAELKLWNRRLQQQRDDAVEDAKKYRQRYIELAQIEQ